MGRSKFPGKPPKTVTRKRIKVLGQSEASQSDSVTVAENIYYGLSLFNETFGDNEKEHPPFHGFSTKEATLSASYIKIQQNDAGNNKKKLQCNGNENVIPQDNEKQNNTLVENRASVNKTNTEVLQNIITETDQNSTKEVTISNSKRTPKINRSKNQRNCKNLKFSNFMKTPVLKSVKNILDQHQRTRQLRNSTAKRLLQRAKSNNNNPQNIRTQSSERSSAVRKFVLPIRSAHSSRVIKPNKRFIEELEEISSMEHNENEVGLHVKKAKISTSKLDYQELKFKEKAVNTMCTKSKDKETRSTVKRIRQHTGTTVRELNDTKKRSEKSLSPARSAQISKPTRKDVKSQNLMNKNKVTDETTCKSPNIPGGSPNVESRGEVTQDSKPPTKSFVAKNEKQTSLLTHDLPTVGVLNSESSRIETRSEILSDTHVADISNVELHQSCENNYLKSQHQGSSNKNTENNPDELESESSLSESGSEHSNQTEDEQSEWSGMKLSGGKVILRKARLKLDNKCISGTEGPFSSNTNNASGGISNLGLTGTIKCGVCGAVRFYRFVKQARKFGIHSCESCRKFISKMIKRQAYAKSTNSNLPVLQCHKGDGLCLVPPVVRSQQWNLMRCVYKARCPACWLKMCLKCYNIPSALRTGLNMLLPSMMRDPLSISLCTGQEESENQGQRLASCKTQWPAEDSLEKNLFKSAMGWKNLNFGHRSNYQTTTGSFLYPKIDKFDFSSNTSPNKKRRKDNRIKVRKKIKNPMFSSSPVEQSPQPFRQRLELRGPRVKHVCRSASVALGQPIATFPTLDGKDANENKHIPKMAKDNDKTAKNDDGLREKQVLKNTEEDIVTQNTNLIQQIHPKKGRSQQNISTSTLPMMSKTSSDAIHTVCIDFWEQYDPVEVGTKGFALIGSEFFHISAICFLCGSAGKEPLIHCQCCCEPYHVFCLEPSEWNICTQPNWCCPQCTVCQSCHLRSGPKLSCVRCRQSFHHSCLSKSGVSVRLYSPDRPYVCQSCIKCKSCGSEGVNVYVGNLPLCSMCFKLRQRGNYCPLCQKCYNGNDNDTKMMECSECSCWVHARCEGLSDERYQILSHLPDSIEFTCYQCSADPDSTWRKAIEAQLKAGFISVIKTLSKNRKACAALKWNPRKECLCRSFSNMKKLESPEEILTTDVVSGKRVTIDEPEDCRSDKFEELEPSLSANLKADVSNKVEYEEQITDGTNRKGLRRLRQKFHLKECSVRVKNCIPKDTHEGDKKDTVNSEIVANGYSNSKECTCMEQQVIVRPSPTLMSIKRKVNCNEYKSLSQFHCDMEQIIKRAGAKDLIETYHKILQAIFPWFSISNFKPDTEIDNVTVPTKETYKNTDSLSVKFNDPGTDIWKKELLRMPKATGYKAFNLHNTHAEDSRSCCLCKGLGDGQELREGRLLYCGQNEWVHANCALWSNEVFEEIDGSLQNVHNAIARGRLIRCSECGKKGASIGCCAKNCSSTFHFLCARNAGLAFNEDKTVFCCSHLSNNTIKTLQNEIDFSLRRPIYVELNRKKKKYAEPNKVKVMIGSLLIDNLGNIPEFSDSVGKIVPCEYKCSRLYWSTVNPFKVVRYYIRTYVQVYVPEASPSLENNITIDHSQERRTESTLTDVRKSEYLTVKQTLESLIDSVCAKEVEEQNNTDFLPPELKEAIFEDLPHDLLDGISMQDIFPKVTYEDFLGMDLKTDGAFSSDLLKDDILPTEDEEIIKPPENKVTKLDQSLTELNSQNDFWIQVETKASSQDVLDDLYQSKNQRRGGRELKRSKSEVLPTNSLIIGAQKHQRSCSLTWSCKLDSNYPSTLKRRKLPRNTNAAKPGETGVNVLDLQNERSSMFHELRLPESIMVAVGKTNTPAIMSDSIRELKCSREEGKEHKRLFWHSRQQPRILQVDGPADTNSASECSSPEYSIEENTTSLQVHNRSEIPQLDGINDEFSCESNEWNSVENKDSSTRTRHTNISQAKRLLGFIRSHVARDSAKRSEHKPNLFRNNNVKLNLKIPQFDGADDISSDDDCISPSINESDGINNIPQCGMMNDHADRPVTCKRCRCTYRTQDSYNRHLANCDIMVTSDSDSEIMDNKLASPDSRFSPSIGSASPQFITLSPSEGHTLSSDYSEIQATSPIEASIPSPHPSMQIEPIAQAIITPQIHTHATVETVHQTVLTSNDMIVQTQYTRTTTTLPNSSVLPQESSVQITEITDTPSVLSSSGISRNVVNVPLTSPDSSSSQTVPSPQVSPTFLSTGVQTATNHSDASQTNVQTAKISKTKSPRAPKSRTKGIKSQIVKNVVQSHNGQVKFQTAQNNTPVIQLQQAQRPSGPTVILQQVASPNIMSAYVETLQQQSGQNLQYIATLGNQHETGFKPQFITTNQLVPGTYIQTPSDNLLALQNGGISILPSVQIAQTQPTVLGTIIQQPPNAIQCGVISSEQLLLSSAPTLEMFTDSTGSMFVSNQPMYYGLETIVSNTVMSSSQFMAGTVPQVLASSYQTTTQVFQASKLMEPIVDVQTVSTVPTVTAVQAVQNVPGVPSVPNVPNLPSVPTMASLPSMSNIPNVPNVPTVSNVPSGYVVVNQTAPIAESIATTRISISSAPESNYTPVVCDPISTAACQPVVETVAPVRMSSDVNPREVPTTALPTIATPSKPPSQQTMTSIPKVAVQPSPVSQTVDQLNNESWKIPQPLISTEQPINNNVRPYFDSKHVSENTSMIKSSISSKVPPLSNHCVTQRSVNVNKLLHDVNNVHNTYSNTVISSNNINVSTNSSPVISNANVQNKITMPTNNVPTSRPMNRVLPMQAVTPKQDLTESLGKSKIIIEEPTKPVMKAAEPEAVDSQKSTVKAVESVKKAEPGLNNTNDIIKLSSGTVEMPKEDLKIDVDKEKLQNTPLKIVLQKQLQDGSYKITHNMKPVTQSKKTPQVASVEILPTKQVSQIASLQLLPLKSFTLKTNKVDENVKPPNSKVNVLKTKTPPVAVKKPRVIAKSMKPVQITPSKPRTQKPYPVGPSLMYEIKSQDGFTHTASSMSEVWETVFRAVQNARKAHNLPPLHHNPLSENLGLENNATIYLVEQLPGVNRCTKYKPKFHNSKPSKTNESENDLPTECDNGAARAEPFRGRKVHDMFSWLASRHRQQPKMIAISEAESRQRVASTNLPMAMRFRILKETSKESVGVYHSHIHGRGLFCLRDIEAGEMVIEYAGEVIRASLTDKREKYYDSKNIGCYMFKIDDHLVVDATMKGNAARFINHSCEPNCYSRVVDILGKKHILIFALRRIVQGEELTYDYKFPFEDIKIPCTCGSRRCRKYLN